MARNKTIPCNVLVIRMSALGDVAMTIPVLYPVCHANPGTRFVMLTRPWPASMFQDCPPNLVVIAADVDKDYKGVNGLLKLAARLRREYAIDAVADLHNVLRSRVIGFDMRLHGVPVQRLDKQRGHRKELVTHRTSHPVTPTHDRYRQVFERLGLSAPDNFTRLFDGKRVPASPMVLDKRPGMRWIAISPFSAHEGKVYSLALMEQVIEQLCLQENYWIFLLGGGKAEKSALRKIAGKHRNVTSIADIKHGFIDEFALLSRCDVMLTMDSANMHLASLVGLETVTVWGATAPSCGFQGYGQDSATDIQLDLPCRPCSIYGEKACRYGDYRCLNNISPDRVARQVINVVEHRTGHQQSTHQPQQ